ncbi:hypothetical protein BGZ63DRAFT_422341 [Mariannaea sp. PMI_226]|nr:hypothetical protein BGZ63DRAFT_422341 [Mariannaea sp. PMI_226]
MSRYYDEEDDIDVRIRHAEPPVRYVSGARRYYDDAGPSYLVAGRSRSHERSRSRDRRASSPPPVIVTNRIYTDRSSSDDDSEDDRRGKSSRSSHRRRKSRSYSRSRSPSSSYMAREEWEAEQARKNLALMQVSNERDKENRRLRDDWEAERTRKDLDLMRVQNDREKDEQRLIKEYQEEEKLQRAKRELNEIKDREARAAEEDRIKKAMELHRLREEDEAKAEASRREKEAKKAVENYKQAEKDRIAKEKKIEEEKEKEAKAAVERYKQAERDRIMKEKQEKEAKDREYNRRLEEDLRRSGLDDKAIEAVIKKEKIKLTEAKEERQHEHQHQHQHQQVALLPYTSSEYSRPANYNQVVANYSHPANYTHPANYQQVAPRPPPPPPSTTANRVTYTRMARKHLSIETLRVFDIDWDYDEDPDYVLIRRWVPEHEQDKLWKHTRKLREKRKEMLLIEEKQHYHLDPEFEWVRKKHDHKRTRSKSPSLLMYLAGAKPK